MFDLRDINKVRWMHPISKVYYVLEYVLVRNRDKLAT